MRNALLIRDVCALLIYVTTFMFIFSINKGYAVLFAGLHLTRTISTAVYNTIGMKRERETLAEFEQLMSREK